MYRFLGMLSLLLAAVPALYGQGQQGSIVGTVKDSTGAMVQGAAVVISSTATGRVVKLTSGEHGEYASPPLEPGPYQLAAEIKGLQKTIQSLTLDVAQQAEVNFSLNPGSASESVTVEAAATPLLETQSAEIGNTRTTQAIESLPLNGRDFVGLMYLTAGVSTNGGGNTLNVSISNQVGVQGGAMNGARTSTNDYIFDGIQSTDNEQGVLILLPNVDAIDQFKVVSSGMNASYGLTGGATINLATKSGTKEFHGSAFEFVRNSALDARNYFDPATIPHFSQNQFGGTFGGRIVRDKVFFFTDYQGTRSSVSETLLSTVPTPLMRLGNFSELKSVIYDPATTTAGPGGTLTRQPFTNATIPSNRFNTTGQNLLLFYPLPNLPGIVNNYLNTPARVVSPNQFDVRIDDYLTSKDSFFVRYSYFNQPTLNPGNFPGPAIGNGPSFPGQFTTAANQVAIGYTHTFTPAFVYQYRQGYSRLATLSRSLNQGLNLADTLGIPGINNYGPNQSGLGPISVTGFTGLGQSTFVPASKITNNFEYDNQIIWNRRLHSINFGYNLLRRDMNIYAPNSGMGSFTFNGQFTQNPTVAAGSGSALADLVLGLDASALISLQSTVGMRRWEHAWYVNDDYRATPKLTFNLGFRYDLILPWTEAHNRQSNLDLASGLLVPVGTAPFPGGYIQAPQTHDFGPRFGVAYQLGSKTVIRGAYGFYFTPNLTTTSSMGVVNAPFSSNFTITNNTTAQNLSTVTPVSAGFPIMQLGNFSQTGTAFNYWPYHSKAAYVMQRNLSIQRQLTTSTVVTVAFVGSRGIHLVMFPNINQPVPGPGAAAARRLYPNLAGDGGPKNVADSYYNSLQVQFDKRFSRGFSLLGSYTYSHSIDDSSSDLQAVSGSPQNPLCLVCDRGNSDFDLRQHLTISWSYKLPFGAGERFGSNWHGAMQALLGAWQLNGIDNFYTGAPFSPSVSTNTLGSGASTQRPNVTGNPNLPKGQRTVSKWFNTAAFAAPALYTYGNAGRNILWGPGTEQWDQSLFKTFPFRKTEERLELRVEAFNVFNRAQFNNPNASIGSTAAGTISSAGNPTFFQRTSRQIQFAVKFYF